MVRVEKNHDTTFRDIVAVFVALYKIPVEELPLAVQVAHTGHHHPGLDCTCHILKNVCFCSLCFVYLYDCVFAATGVWTASVSSWCTGSHTAQFVDSLEVHSAQKTCRRVCKVSR